MTIILNVQTLKELGDNNMLEIIKKNQASSYNFNYYFTPTIGINLYDAKVFFTNPKYIVFQFDKTKNINLWILLKKISSFLHNELKKQHSELFNVQMYDIMSETDVLFTIRCHLPNYKGKYLITCLNDNLQFKQPNFNIYYKMATLEIRNAWLKDSKFGFNLELKNVQYYA